MAAPSRELAAAGPCHVSPHRGDTAGGHGRPRHGVPLRRPHVPTVRRRVAGRRLAELLLPRRAVHAHGGRHRSGDRGDGGAPSACCIAGTGRGRDARRPPPACSSSSRSGTPTAARPSSGPTRRGASCRPNGCRRRSATPTAATSWNGWTGGCSPRDGRAPATTPARGRRSPSSGRPAPRRSAASTRSAPPSGRHRSIRSVCTLCRAARWWRTSAPCTRHARGWFSPRASRGQPWRSGPAISSIPTARSRRCTALRGRTSHRRTSCEEGARPSKHSPSSASVTCR